MAIASLEVTLQMSFSNDDDDEDDNNYDDI